jgi:hypothetical protein
LEQRYKISINTAVSIPQRTSVAKAKTNALTSLLGIARAPAPRPGKKALVDGEGSMQGKINAYKITSYFRSRQVARRF